LEKAKRHPMKMRIILLWKWKLTKNRLLLIVLELLLTKKKLIVLPVFLKEFSLNPNLSKFGALRKNTSQNHEKFLYFFHKPIRCKMIAIKLIFFTPHFLLILPPRIFPPGFTNNLSTAAVARCARFFCRIR